MRKKIYVLAVLCIAIFGAVMYGLSKIPKEIDVKGDITNKEPTVIIQEKDKLILGYVREMKATCYTLVEFASKGITANGYAVQSNDGWFTKEGRQFVAQNGLAFGTKVKIEGFGDTVFEVIDRIGYGTEIDIYWGDGIDAYRDCLANFGAKKVEVLVLQDKTRAFPN